MLLAAIALAPVSPSASAAKPIDITLLSNEFAVVMDGTGVPTMPIDLLKTVVDVLNYLLGTEFVVGSNVNNLTTPETLHTGTYIQGEEILLAELQKVVDDAVTIFGVSQSAGIEGIALSAIAENPSAYPSDLHIVALAPPSMPQFDGAAGLFQNPADQWLMKLLYPSMAQPFPTDNGGYTVDVYCGMYDPVCDEPTKFDLISWWNSLLGLFDIHLGYATLTPAEFTYEIDHAQELTSISTESTHFYLMPDIYNFGTAANPDYQPFLPILSWATFSKPLYDLLEPTMAALVNAGYDRADHPLPASIPQAADIFAGPWLSDLWQGVTAALAHLDLLSL